MQFFALVLALLSLTSRADSPKQAEPILPLPTSGPTADPAKIQLGQLLFHEKKLSKDESVSCASCHNLQRGGADGLNKPVGINGAVGEVNTPTVLNSGFNFRQFWNGRVKTLEAQIDGPLQDPKEMGSNWESIIAKLKSDPEYTKRFSSVYADGITPDNVRNALATFERSLVTPNSKFDRFLRGERAAISNLEKDGYRRFKSLGCVACHQGVNVGGNMFQTMGVMGNYFKDRKTPVTEADLGRFAVTKREHDKHVFRVPSLRNVELTAPYFHDGSAATLEDAVKTMAKYQLGKDISTEETRAIVAFLKTLTGQAPASNRQVAGENSK